MELIELITLAVFDIIAYILVSKKIISYKNLNKGTYIIFTFIFSILVGLSRWYLPGNYSIIAPWFIVMGMVFILYRQGIRRTIYLCIISTTIILSIQFAVVIIFKLLGKELEFTFLNGLAAQSFGLLLAILISVYIPINLIFQYVVDNKIFRFLIPNLFVILFSLLLYWNMDIDGVFRNIISIAVISAGIIYVNFVLIKEGIKNEYEKRQLQTYENYLPVIDELIGELKIKQHEFDNHIQALNMLAVTGTGWEKIIDSMEDYISNLGTDSDLGTLIKLDNKVLAGFLYSNMKKAENLNMEFQIIIKDYGFNVKLRDYELIEVIGNLINNAFEAETENNIVILKLKREGDMNIAEIRNKHSYLKQENISRMFNKGFSTKSDSNRGCGLYNVRKILRKYGGEIEVFNEMVDGDNYIVFRVLLTGH